MDHFSHMTLAQASAPSGEEMPITPSTPELGSPSTPTAGGLPSPHGGTTSSPAATQPTPQPNTLMSFLPMLLLGALMVYLLMGGPRRGEKKKREAMLAAIKKGDKVLTIGGIIGSVVEVRDDEIVLKVDENSNTRIKFTRGAIQTVVADKAETSA